MSLPEEPIRNPILKRLAAALGASIWVESAEELVFGSHVLAARLVHWTSAANWWNSTFEHLELPEASPCRECGRPTHQGRSIAQIMAPGVGLVDVRMLLLGHDHGGAAITRDGARSVFLVESMRVATNGTEPQTLAESSIRFESALAPSSAGDINDNGPGAGNELDNYLKSMGHRLRTELTNLLGYSESLREADSDSDSDGFKERSLERIDRAGQTVVEIVDELELHLVREHARRNLALTLRKISMVLASSLDLNEVILKIHECIAQITHFERSRLLWVYDGYLEVASTVPPVRMDINASPFDQVFENLPQVQYIARIDHAKLSREADICPAYNSWLCLPLMGPTGPIALITLESELEDSYDNLDLDLLNAFAHHAFLALSNARRFSETRKLLEFDPLTRALSRNYFLELAQQKLDAARHAEESLCVMMFDVDHFKRVNDTYGHNIGDMALQHVVDHAQLALRPVDLLGRYGGEEFVVLLPGIDLQVAMAIADRVRRRIEISEVETEEESFRVTISAGVAMYHPTHDTKIETLIKRADATLYRAKAGGRNQVVAEIIEHAEDTVEMSVEMTIEMNIGATEASED